METLRGIVSLLSRLLPLRVETGDDDDGRGQPPNPQPPNDGTVPIEGTPPVVQVTPETPPEGTPPVDDPTKQQALDEAAQLRQANERIQELEAQREDKINEAAEQRLYELLPELPDEIETERRRRQQPVPQAAPPPQPQDPDEPPSDTERLAYLESRQGQLEADRDSERPSPGRCSPIRAS